MPLELAVRRGRLGAAGGRARGRRCCPQPAPLRAGPPTARVAHRGALRAPRAQACSRRRASSSATRSASPRATSSGRRARPRCSCCRASSRCSRAARAGATGTAARRRGAPVGRGRGRPRRPAPAPPRRARVAHLLAGAGPRRRARGAPAARRGRHAAARRARPARRRGATSDARRGGARRRVARACTWPRPAAARCCCPGDRRADRARRRRSPAGRTLHVRLALVGPAPRPRRSAASRRAAARSSTSPRPRRSAPPRALAHAPRRRRGARRARRDARPARDLHRRRLPRLRAVASARRGGGREAATCVRAGAAARRRRAAPARAAAGAPAPVARLRRPSSPLALLRRRCSGRRCVAPGARPAAPAVAVAAGVGAGGSCCSCRARRRHAGARRGRRGAARWRCVLALLVAGVPAAAARPARLGRAAAGIGAGHRRAAGVTVPYRGVDEWVRIALILRRRRAAGRASPRCWPSGRGRARRPASRPPAAVALGALYAIPVVEPPDARRSWAARVFAVLLAAFLWLERLRAAARRRRGRRRARGAPSRALLVAPRLDGRRPWLDYEQIADGPRSRERPTTFDWDHNYGPLDWPRDGREVLRDQGRAPAPTGRPTNLDEFDGVRWRRTARRSAP